MKIDNATLLNFFYDSNLFLETAVVTSKYVV